jgi:SAM-dependent methyltransferase
MSNINLGCGSQILDGWINVDYSLGAKLAKIPMFPLLNKGLNMFSMEWDKRIFLHDLRKPFPWGDATADNIYSSHTLEHLSRDEGKNFLTECHRVLKPNGLIRILVPDLTSVVDRYRAGELRADHFVEGLGVLYGGGKASWKKSLSPFIEFPHKCMYDVPTLVAILNDIGFDAHGRKAFESSIPGIHEIELQNRTVDAVIVEGKKKSFIQDTRYFKQEFTESVTTQNGT